MEQASDARVTEALHAACSAYNPLALLSLLRSARPAAMDARAADGNTPLTKVCGLMGSGDGIRCATILLQRGANVNATRADGWTPLAIATMAGRGCVAELLLAQHGIDVNPVVDVNWKEVEQLWPTWGALHPEGIDTTMTPLLIAASRRNTWIVAQLLRHDDIDTLATTGGTRAEQIAKGYIAAMIIEARRTQAYRSRRGKIAAMRIQRFLRDTTCNPVYAAARRSLERIYNR
jgi:ankyrin repeat protein